MRAMNGTSMDDGPDDIEALLPWYVAGTLSAGDARRVTEALGRDAALQQQCVAIRQEQAGTVAVNEALGAPSARVLRNLMAAIDAQPARATAPSPRQGRFERFFAGLSPRALAWSASFGAMALLLQAGLIGVILTRSGLEAFQSPADRRAGESAAATQGRREPAPQPPQSDRPRSSVVVPQPQVATRSMAPSNAGPPGTIAPAEVVAAVTFRPEARMSNFSALLGSYRASVIDSHGGVLRLRFEGMTTAADLAVILAALSRERIVAEAVAAR